MTDTKTANPTVGSMEWRQRETNHTIRFMEELCGYRKPTSHSGFASGDFVGKGYVFTEDMQKFIWNINFIHKPTAQFPYEGVMRRWYLLNSLLAFGDQLPPLDIETMSVMHHDPGYDIYDHRHLLATMLGFALLEEVSFQLSGKWDEHGVVRVDIDNPRLQDKSGGQKRYKAGKAGKTTISNFQHKLILMEEALPPHMQKLLAEMNKKLEAECTGDHPREDLYTRFYNRRNRLAHGASCDGWDAWLISLLLNCIYLSFDENFTKLEMKHSIPDA